MAVGRILRREQHLAGPLVRVFDFFSDASNLESITPNFLSFRIHTPLPIQMARGTKIEYRLVLAGVPVYWRTVISEWEPPFLFVDEQEAGPFEYWRHEHRFEDHGDSITMVDQVTYREPLGLLGTAAHYLFVKRLLERVFDHRALAMEAQLKSVTGQAAP